tara:strand:+ start:3325 stop:4116 length:792 start_codon:yes stop_codon:yes gene_type:complete
MRITQNNFIARTSDSNKSHFGRALIVAGSSNMPGAAILATRAAYAMGVGYVYHDSFSPVPDYFSACPDAIKGGLANLQDCSAFLIGPGIPAEEIAAEYIGKLVAQNKPLILDAGALDFLSKNSLSLHENCLLTPHEGEMARLWHCDSSKVKKSPDQFAKDTATKWNCSVLLKGATNYFYSHNQLDKISTGNPGLATAGSGDVLAGILVALLAQKPQNFYEQILAGVDFHGYLATQWSKDKSQASLSADSLVKQIAHCLKDIEK